MKSQLAIVLEEKLKSTDNFSRNYAAVYFLRTLPQLENPWLTKERSITLIVNAVKDEDPLITDALVNNLLAFPDEWQQEFASRLKTLTDPERPRVFTGDGVPFLTSSDDGTGEDLPF